MASQRRYHEMRGVFAASLGIVLVFGLVAGRGRESSLTFAFGPCQAPTCPAVLGVEVRTWPAWALCMATVVCKEGLLTYGYTTYSPWFSNEVMDHKAASVARPTWQVMLMVVVWKTWVYTATVVDIGLIVSGNVQFIVAALVSEVVVCCANTRVALLEKDGTYGEL